MTTRISPREITGALTGTGAGDTYKFRKGGKEYPRDLLVQTTGDLSGTFHVEMSAPDANTWTQLTDIDGTQLQYTNNVVLRLVPVGLADVRVNCSAYTSGTLNYSIREG